MEALVIDEELELKMMTTLSDFHSDQESSLKAEKLAVSEKTQVLINEISEMNKIQVDLKQKITTVLEILEREQALSNEFAENTGKTREAIESGQRYIENLRERLSAVEYSRQAIIDQQRANHREILAQIESLATTKKAMREALDEAVEERDDLMGRWQAKLEIQKQSDIESTLHLPEQRIISGIENETAERLEVKSEKIDTLLETNSSLKQVLQSLEAERKKYTEANKRLEAERGILEKQMAAVVEEEKRFRDEAKNVKFAKGTNSKVIEQRIMHLKKEAEALEEQNAELQEQINARLDIQKDLRSQNQKKFDLFGDNDDFDNLVALKAKPRIFGDQE